MLSSATRRCPTCACRLHIEPHRGLCSPPRGTTRLWQLGNDVMRVLACQTCMIPHVWDANCMPPHSAMMLAECPMMTCRPNAGRAEVRRGCRAFGCDGMARPEAVWVPGRPSGAARQPSGGRRRLAEILAALRVGRSQYRSSTLHVWFSRRAHSVDGAECAHQQSRVSGMPRRYRKRRGRCRRRDTREVNFLGRVCV